jgi:AcrR family transcriptional regulator
VARDRQSAQARGYTMRARQDAVAQTRLLITEATMRLHERVGPRHTTVSAIAVEAGVTRLTVYRHFPDDEALVSACSAHWRGLHPRPDPASWSRIEDPLVRLRTALAQTYVWARTAAPMMTKIHRDVEVMPAFVAASLAADEAARVAVLAAGFPASGRQSQRLAGALAHALRVSTWESLCVRAELDETEAIELMVGAVLAALNETPPVRSARRRASPRPRPSA